MRCKAGMSGSELWLDFEFIRSQEGAVICQHDQLLRDVRKTLKSVSVQVGQMGSQVSQLSTSLPPPVPAAPPSSPISVCSLLLRRFSRSENPAFPIRNATTVIWGDAGVS
ncbi:hypothetical protein SKAU_G00192170 [Synaphobranchus kaupii]|uniref:Uncharacterized protein n=1 Tax=Synaphobranchus kaupii TaxID=118154 RepID=A0A9Q1IXD7_SYNKA|nr:hypothetical protein SKAU_G00192170 [Synaphobranchus kaupii]